MLKEYLSLNECFVVGEGFFDDGEGFFVVGEGFFDESESFFEKKKASVDEKFFCGLLKSVKSDRVDYSNYF